MTMTVTLRLRRAVRDLVAPLSSTRQASPGYVAFLKKFVSLPAVHAVPPPSCYVSLQLVVLRNVSLAQCLWLTNAVGKQLL